MRIIFFILPAVSILFIGCGTNQNQAENGPITASCAAKTVRPVSTPSWTSDFSDWLNSNGYAHIAANQGFGGMGTCTLSADKNPMILLHGNSSNSDPTASFGTFKTYFINNGYVDCDLFAITWIESNSNGSAIHHKADYIKLARDFIKAVKAYTGKSKVDVVGWSMGVTIGRKAIKGGVAYNDPGRTFDYGCDLGANISNDIGTFLGVAGVNRGLNLCTGVSGNSCSENAFKIDSQFLADLNGGSGGNFTPGSLADYVYSIYLTDDEYICGDNPRGFGISSCIVNGVHTSRIPQETFGKSFDVDNASFPGWGSNDYCMSGSLRCDHITVFYDSYTGATGGALNVMLKMLKDHTTN